jgi:integrase
MARPTKGAITIHVGKDGLTYRSLRFTAYGKRRRVPLGPVSQAHADDALRHTLAEVECKVWVPAMVESPESAPVPTFHEFAEEWWVRNEKRFAAKTSTDYRWRLAHLLPHFAELPLDAITFDTVERYIAAKLAEDDPLSSRSINMTVILLGAILESAVERELIARNPAKGKGRRVRERAPSRSYLETAAQIDALLCAAGDLDREATLERRHIERRALLATLTFAGLRIGELCALRWRDVDLAAGWLHVGEAKTDAGRRRVKIRGALRDTLLDVRARCPHADQDAFVFGTRSGARQSADNVRSRTLRLAVERASSNLAGRGLPPLPERITPHSLRRTFCSLLYALSEPPTVVMAEMGHANPGLALAVYAQAMRRGEDETARLRELVEGEVLANSGQRDKNEAAIAFGAEAA